jgi:DNA repair protein RadC
LSQEAHEWLLALYVDEHFQLLCVDTVARGDISSCKVPFWKLIDRGHQLKAAGFVLVHNHPSGDARASQSDIQLTRRLAYVSRELEIPLLDHLIVAGTQVREVGEWHYSCDADGK